MIVLKDPLTVREVAREYRVDPETVRRWIRSGSLAASRPPRGHYRIWRKDLERFLTRVRGKE